MSVETFCREIGFRYIQPTTRIPDLFWRLLYRFPRLQHVLERWNIRLPHSYPQKILSALSGIPRMSTRAIGAIINVCVREMPENTCYLNIGTWHGYSLFAGMVGNADKRCIGVDSFEQFGQPKLKFRHRFEALRSDCHAFYEMDWRQYITDVHRETIGVLFYDARHDEESQYDALTCCDPMIAEGGIVLVDDTNWTGPKNGTQRFLREHENYNVIFSVSTPWNCHPTYWNGLMILRKGALR